MKIFVVSMVLLKAATTNSGPNIEEVRGITEPWVDQYNNERPHESLANLSPINFKKMRDKTTEIPL
ncbi:transposase [Piscirickettsia salmonis]|uniref:transposase n=2 Tax=Piscirickettsia salmonis TaxID=1238 RepID=UPI001E3B081B|nr:transposase [Piscirickettsia salmonis]